MPVIGAGAGASPWTPADPGMPPLVVWYDAADTSTLLLASNKVATWLDKSPNHRDLNQTTDSARPTISVIGNRPAVQFNIGLQMIGPTFTLGAPLTVAVQCIYDSLASQGTVVFLSSGSTALKVICGAQNARSHWNLGGTNTNFSTLAPTAGSQATHLNVYRTNGTVLARLNGIEAAAATVGSSSGDGIKIGAAASGANIVGKVGEVIIFGDVLNTQQSRHVEQYLAAKWSSSTQVPLDSSPLVFR